MIVAVSLDAVCDGQIPSCGLTASGLALMRSLAPAAVSVYLYSPQGVPEVVVRDWLVREGIGGYTFLATRPETALESPLEFKVFVTSQLLAGNVRPDLYFDNDVASVIEISNLGVHSLLLVDGETPQPVERKFRAWDELVDTLEERHLAKARRAQEMEARWQ